MTGILGLKLVGSAAANGSSGTIYTDAEFEKGATYLVIIRPANDNTTLSVIPIMGGYYNQNYIAISSDNKLGAKLGGTYGFAYFYKFIRI